MKKLLCLSLLFAATCALAQAPQRPLIPLNTWSLPDYHAIDVSKAFTFPDGLAFDSVAGLDIAPSGNMIVLHRGAKPFLEFAPDGSFIRNFGDEGSFTRAHGMRIDGEGNLWVTDVGAHFVRKLDKDGNTLMTIGTPGTAGAWDEAANAHLLNQPNETALDSHGNIYVVQGHGTAEPNVLKFSPSGEFIKKWGSRGTGPGQFFAAHSIEIDSSDNLYIADRENFRVEIFDVDGNYKSEWKFNAMVCGLYLHSDGFMYMTTGFDGEWAKVDMAGTLLGSLGSSGTGNGQFGEAHYLVLDGDDNVFVADVVNKRVQKYQKD